MASGTIMKQAETPTLYSTTPYSGTTTSGNTIVATITLPKGKYVAWEEGYISTYGGYIYNNDGTDYGYVHSKRNITLDSDTTFKIGPASSVSTSWTLYSVCFLKVG